MAKNPVLSRKKHQALKTQAKSMGLQSVDQLLESLTAFGVGAEGIYVQNADGVARLDGVLTAWLQETAAQLSYNQAQPVTEAQALAEILQRFADARASHKILVNDASAVDAYALKGGAGSLVSSTAMSVALPRGKVTALAALLGLYLASAAADSAQQGASDKTSFKLTIGDILDFFQPPVNDNAAGANILPEIKTRKNASPKTRKAIQDAASHGPQL